MSENEFALIPFQDVQTMAQAAAASRLFGCDKPEQALSLMLLAQAKGLHPMLAVERYHIIQEKPSMKAETMLAEFLRNGGIIKWIQRDEKAAEAEFSHPAGGTIKVRWTLEMAAIACNNKSMYTKYPRQMLHARCISEGVRAIFPECVLGVYTPEEINGMTPADKTMPVMKVTGDGIEQPRDTRPQSDRLADAIGGTPTVEQPKPGADVADAEWLDLPAEDKAPQLREQIKAVCKATGSTDGLKTLLAQRKAKKLSDLNANELAAVLAELVIQTEKPQAPAPEPDFFSPEEQQRQAEEGNALEREMARKKFFAVVKEKLGKGINHHDIIGTEASLNTMTLEDMEQITGMIDAGEFDHLKKTEATA